MAGSRGKLKLANPLTPVAEAVAGSAAGDVQALAPAKPAAVEQDKELSQLWDEIVPQLDAAGLVSTADAATVEICLRHFMVARLAYRRIDGDVVVADHNHGGVKKNPAEAVFRAESDLFLKYAQQLGMTFVSRARTPATRGADDDDNPFASSAGG